MKNLAPIIFLLLASTLSAQTPFHQLFKATRIAEKKAIWVTLSAEEKDQARRLHLTWAKTVYALDEEQTEFVDRLSANLDPALEEEALTLFPKEIVKPVFGSIGPYRERPCSVFVTVSYRLTMANCPCNVGSSFNMSCDKPCGAAAGQCTQTPSDCGFLWMYPCDGYCQSGYAPEDPPQS